MQRILYRVTKFDCVRVTIADRDGEENTVDELIRMCDICVRLSAASPIKDHFSQFQENCRSVSQTVPRSPDSSIDHSARRARTPPSPRKP